MESRSTNSSKRREEDVRRTLLQILNQNPPLVVSNASSFTLGLSYEEELELAMKESAASNFQSSQQSRNLRTLNAGEVANPPYCTFGPPYEGERDYEEELENTLSQILSRDIYSDTPGGSRQNNLLSLEHSTDLVNQNLRSHTLQESQTNNSPSSEELTASEWTCVLKNLFAPAPAPAPPEVPNISSLTLGLSDEEELELAMRASESNVSSARNEEELVILSPEQFKSLVENNNEPPKREDKNNKSQKSNEQSDPDNKRCKICFDKPLDCVLVPCGHLTTCSQCARRLQLCPICRKIISNKVKVFTS